MTTPRKPRKDTIVRRDAEALQRATPNDYLTLAATLDNLPGSLMPLGAALARRELAHFGEDIK